MRSHQGYAGRTPYDADYAFFEVLKDFKERHTNGADPIYWREVAYEPDSSQTVGCQRMVSGFLARYEQCTGRDLLRTLKLSLTNETAENQTIDVHGVYAQVSYTSIYTHILLLILIHILTLPLLLLLLLLMLTLILILTLILLYA